MNDEQLELATAYLDGEATAQDRVRVESDPELLAEVDRQRAVRAALGDVEPPTSAARESAVAAALAAFDELRVTAPPGVPTAPTNVVTIERRRRLRRIQALSAAAAAIVIVGGGVAVLQRGGDSAEQDSAERRDSIPMLEATATTDAPMMAAAPTTLVDEEAGAAADAAGDPVFASEPATPPAAADAAEAAPTTVSAPAPAGAPLTTTVTDVVRDADDLAELAQTLKTEPPDLDDAEVACAENRLKADAIYEALDGTRQSVVVVVLGDGEPPELGAMSLDDCEIVLR